MEKTGESYTAARARILAKGGPPPEDYPEIAGMSNAAVAAKTGKTWPQWVRALNRHGADKMTHTEIAKSAREEFGATPWWAQSVAVGYGRIRGLREIGQGCDGDYKASKSKTFKVPIDRLYKAFSSKRGRERWLGGTALRIRTSTANRSMRITWEDGTSVSAWFTDKGPGKSQVAIQHEKLADRADIERRKAYWAERFAALEAWL
ncbi:hypothetical protein BJP37_11820 [Moorena bouillonii PNG]|uniref:Uncharacterized protein n=2 Tax=Moorena TaxID=1155738 RepID=A0A1U7NBA7_9CYAN|nr:hypothetical protein BJP37_11820 [Moorena bouillonii PNG]